MKYKILRDQGQFIIFVWATEVRDFWYISYIFSNFHTLTPEDIVPRISNFQGSCLFLLFLLYGRIKWLTNFLSLCPLFFVKFLFFHQTIALQKLWKMFFISSKTPFVLQIFKLFVIFSLPFHTFQIQNDKWKWNNLWCHELACINLQV